MVPLPFGVRLLAAAFCLSSPLFGTTIAGIWTEKQITIAADSRQMTVQGGRLVPSPNGACKVYEVRHLIFALAGLAQVDQISIVDEIRNSVELKEMGTGRKLPVDSLIVGSIAAVVKVLRAHSATYAPDATIQLLIAGAIDGKLQMYRVEMSGIMIYGDYSLPRSTRRYGYPESRGHDDTDRNRGIEVIGIDDSVKRFQRVLPEWSKGDDISVARRLVSIEASDTVASQAVGAPIATIVIDKKGAHWIDKGVCTWEPAPVRK
jgi:hypothetical protein